MEASLGPPGASKASFFWISLDFFGRSRHSGLLHTKHMIDQKNLIEIDQSFLVTLVIDLFEFDHLVIDSGHHKLWWVGGRRKGGWKGHGLNLE